MFHAYPTIRICSYTFDALTYTHADVYISIYNYVNTEVCIYMYVYTDTSMQTYTYMYVSHCCLFSLFWLKSNEQKI